MCLVFSPSILGGNHDYIHNNDVAVHNNDIFIGVNNNEGTCHTLVVRCFLAGAWWVCRAHLWRCWYFTCSTNMLMYAFAEAITLGSCSETDEVAVDDVLRMPLWRWKNDFWSLGTTVCVVNDRSVIDNIGWPGVSLQATPCSAAESQFSP